MVMFPEEGLDLNGEEYEWSDSPALNLGRHKLTVSSRAGCWTSLGFLMCNQEGQQHLAPRLAIGD